MDKLSDTIFQMGDGCKYYVKRVENPFEEIAVRLGVSKLSYPYYMGAFWKHLQHLREEPITLLEIGVAQGESLRMWEEWFPNAKIYGIDIDPLCSKFESDRTKVFIGNQADKDFMESVVAVTGPLDVVVDDGGHQMKEQQDCLRLLWPHLKPFGTYVIEDLDVCYGPDVKNRTTDFLKALVDDQYVGYHHETPLLGNVQEIHFYHSMCVLIKSGEVVYGG